MASGKHTKYGIPATIAKLKKIYPKVEIEKLPPIGEHRNIYLSMLSIIKNYLQENI